jgi:hypothetical protein
MAVALVKVALVDQVPDFRLQSEGERKGRRKNHLAVKRRATNLASR